MKYRMRMLSDHRRQLQTLLSDTAKEQACFLLCRSACSGDEILLLVIEVIPLGIGDLNVHSHDQLSVSPDAMLRVARYAQNTNTAVCMVHTHPLSYGEVAFSYADDVGNLRTFEFFHRMIPHKFHSCLVWDAELQYVAGRVYDQQGHWEPISSVDSMDNHQWRRYTSKSLPAEFPDLKMFDRQSRILGEHGQNILAGQKVGVIGLGGIGSVVATILGHSGCTHISLVDFDHAEQSNLPRLLGATQKDIDGKRLKVEIAEGIIKSLNSSADVFSLSEPVESPGLLKSLVGLDVLICCTDDTTSRAFLNQLCHQYYVPVLDLGVQFVTDKESGSIEQNIGKVHLMLPGTACLQCSGHISSIKLAEESLTPSQFESRKAEGYIRGVDVAEPAMMIFNMQVASRGIQILLSWFTGLCPIDPQTYERFDFFNLHSQRNITSVRKRSDPACQYCGIKAPLSGAGDEHEMLTRPRTRTNLPVRQYFNL